MPATLTADKPNPAHGATVTVTYSSVPDDIVTVSGTVQTEGGPLVATTTLDVAPKYNLPTAPGLTFVATADPKVFTTVIP